MPRTPSTDEDGCPSRTSILHPTDSALGSPGTMPAAGRRVSTQYPEALESLTHPDRHPGSSILIKLYRARRRPVRRPDPRPGARRQANSHRGPCGEDDADELDVQPRSPQRVRSSLPARNHGVDYHVPVGPFSRSGFVVGDTIVTHLSPSRMDRKPLAAAASYVPARGMLGRFGEEAIARVPAKSVSRRLGTLGIDGQVCLPLRPDGSRILAVTLAWVTREGNRRVT